MSPNWGALVLYVALLVLGGMVRDRPRKVVDTAGTATIVAGVAVAVNGAFLSPWWCAVWLVLAVVAYRIASVALDRWIKEIDPRVNVDRS